MAKSNKSAKLRIIPLVLSILMVLSFGLFALCACSTDDEEDDSSSETRTDTQTFSNADFEYFTDSDGSYVIGSADSWTSSSVSNDSNVSASSSSAKSGIVDTASSTVFDETSWEAYKEDPENGTFDWSGFYYAYKDYVYYDSLDEEDDADELEDAVYYTDVDNYYDIPGWDIYSAYLDSLNTDGESSVDFTDSDTILSDEYKDAFIEYIRALNPGTHWTGSDDESTLNEEKGTHVLMLHNYRTAGYGTAMQYASSSITLQAGTAASVSVWVKTSDLTYNDGTSVAAGNRGAFIEISNTVGGTTQDSLVVRNINTEILNPAADENTPAENNGWVQYTFYVRASSYADTTFTVNLGLGRQAAGNTANYYDYVQGYAFFDDLTYNVFKASDWADVVGGTYNGGDLDVDGDGTAETPAAAQQTCTLDTSSLSDKGKFDAQNTELNNGSYATVFALDLDELNGKMKELENLSASTTVAETEDDRYTDSSLTEHVNVGNYFTNGKSLYGTNDIAFSGVKSDSNIITGGSYPGTVKDDFANFANLPFGSSSILMLYSGKGAPYTAAVSNTAFSVAKGETLMVSFWVKTSDMANGTGATVTLIDGETETAIGAVDTTTLDTVDISDDYNKTEDIFDGWQFCAFYVTNQQDNTLTFTLEFSIGPTTITGTSITDYVPGYAAFANLSTYKMTDEQAELAATGDYAVSVELTGDTYSDGPTFDTPATNDKSLETGIANPGNYTGVYGGSYYVGGSDPSVSDDQNVQSTEISAGLLSRDYVSDYANDTQNATWVSVFESVNSITGTGLLDSDSWWSAYIGADCTQPLIIAKTVADSYGFVANTESSVSTSSYAQVVVRVKLSPHTRAAVYLIDTTEPDINDPADEGKLQYADKLKHETGISYRYDEDGNLVNLDPDDDNFDRRDNILLYYQDNGLWAKERNYTGSEFYANLSNYEADEDGNLTDGADTIIYYLHDGAFYRYYDEDSDTYEVQVKDFTEAGIDLTGAQLQATSEHDLYQVVENDTADVSGWIYIRFFIASGDESKSYRLEFWSGDREGESGSTTDASANSANYVIFDVVQYSDLDETSFNNLIDAQMTTLAKALNYTDADALEEAYLADPTKFMNGFTDSDTVDGELVYFHYSLYDDNSYAPFDADRTDGDDPYSSYDPTSYENTVSYLKYSFEDSGRTYYDTYVNYAASEVSVSDSSSSDDTTDEDTTATPDYNIWLLISSILLAAALIITLLALLLRKLLSGMKRKGDTKKAPAYSNRREMYIRKLRQEETEREDEPEENEEDLFTDAELYNETEQPEGEETDAPEENGADDGEPSEQKDGGSSDDGKNE